MKKVLIVIDSMGSGGAQKSLISFLTCLYQSGEYKDYKIDLMIEKPEGMFLNEIPENINIVPAPREMLWLGTPFKHPLLKQNRCIKGLWGKIKYIIRNKTGRFDSRYNLDQRMWESWKNLIPKNPEKYDIAISYLHGVCNYYVIDKVKAEKKVLWIHHEYQKVNFEAGFDKPYYGACQKIITISKKCVDSFTEIFPENADKIEILENITIRDDILRRGSEGEAEEFKGFEGLKILSIGRLCEQKGFDFAIEAAKVMKERGVPFLWIILGEGPDRDMLQGMVNQYGLEGSFEMIGVRENPYVYIKTCDVFAQTSRHEGKSIALDEAMTFCKPILATNYPTVYDSLENEVNGLIVSMDGVSIADGIIRLHKDIEVTVKLIHNLQNNIEGNEKELQRYIDVML